MTAVISTRGLVKRYGRVRAVDGVDLDVRAGDVYGFLGANGSGKTTTVRMLLGLVLPTSGSIELLGERMPRAGRRVLPRVGALIEGPAHYGHLSGRENLSLLDASGRGGARRTRSRRVSEALGQLSGDYKKATVWGSLQVTLLPEGEAQTRLDLEATANVDNVFAAFGSPGKKIIERSREVVAHLRANPHLDRDYLLRIAKNPEGQKWILCVQPRSRTTAEGIEYWVRPDSFAQDRIALQGICLDLHDTPHPLEAARHRLRRLDLDHQIDRAHVDPQLERRGRDQAGQLPRLQHLLDHQPLLVRERAVVRAGDLDGLRVVGQALIGQLIQPLRQALRTAAVVDEDDRRRVLPDERQELGVDRRPDRSLCGSRVEVGVARGSIEARVAPVAPLLRGRVGVRHVLDRDDDLQVQILAHPGVDDLALPVGSDQEGGDPLERALRRRQADALNQTTAPRLLRFASGAGAVRAGLLLMRSDQMLQPLQRQRQVRAALRLRDGVDLVDDHRLDPGEDLVRPRAHHQVQRLGRRDQDVRRLSQHRLALALRRVARSQPDRDRRPHTPKRRAQVALHVVGERLERRDVDDPNPLPQRLGVLPLPVLARRGAPRERVDPPQERRQRLARSRRRADQRVRAGRDRRPALGLRGRGRLERGLEPAPNRRRERRQRVRFHTSL